MAMARPMGRPSGPPIALICTVILLVIAIVVAVALYLQMAKYEKDIADVRASNTDLTRQAEKAKKDLEKLLTVFPGGGAVSEGAASMGQQAIEKLQAALETIPNRNLNAKEMSAFLNAVARIGDIRKVEKEKPGEPLSDADKAALDLLTNLSCRSQAQDLVSALRLAAEQSQKNYDALQVAKKDAEDAKKAAQDADAARVVAETKATQVANDEAKKRADLETAHKTELDGKDAEIAKRDKAIDAAQKNYEALRIDFTNKVAEKDVTIAKKDVENADLQRILREKFQVLTVQKSFEGSTAKLPDGAIAQVFADMNMVNLRLRNPNQAKLGMRYEIFGKDKPIPDNLEGKATVEVSSVETGSVQAKIIRTTPGDPIITGDRALNLIVGPVKFNFVVFGDFDLTGEGLPAPNGKSQIETLVKNWGANVQQNVDITTNFLILGEQPQVPLKPQPGAAPLVVKDFDTKVAANEKWTKLHDWATSHTIPIMNTVTFLHGIGYFNYDHAPGWEKRVRPNDDYFVP